ncbi:endonuclease/exonuclease/phosphatase family protein [Niabella terrae]
MSCPLIFKRLQLFFLIFFAASCLLNAQRYQIASYNLRFASPSDSGNLWQDRRAAVASLIDFHDFDAFGTQEGLPEQLDDLITALPQYSRYGKGRDDGSDKGEHSAIFYKKDKFRLVEAGDFWLSETPDKPGLGWDATCCNRICSWVRLEDKASKKQFYFFNVHFDHQGKIARIESAKLMLQKIRTIAKKMPVVLTGDFNGDRQSQWYRQLNESELLRDSYLDVKTPYELNGSFSGFRLNRVSSHVIDHIFVNKGFKALKWGILTDTYYGKAPSDHFPVVASLALQ